MKRIVLAALIIITMSGIVFAQDYIVQEVTGRVEKNTGADKWELLKVGEKLNAETIIRTVAGASLKVKAGERILTIGPMKNGKLAGLTGSGGIQIQGRVSQTDTAEVSSGTGRVSTASARASESADDIEIEEE